MKIKVKTKEGAEKSIKAENITIDGVRLSEFYLEFLRLKRNFEVFERKYEEDNEEVHRLWRNVKSR